MDWGQYESESLSGDRGEAGRSTSTPSDPNWVAEPFCRATEKKNGKKVTYSLRPV